MPEEDGLPYLYRSQFFKQRHYSLPISGSRGVKAIMRTSHPLTASLKVGLVLFLLGVWADGNGGLKHRDAFARAVCE